MKICLSVVTLMLSLAFAQSSTYTFADIPWLSSKERVIDTLTARGYTVEFDTEDSLHFWGTLFHRHTNVLTQFNQDDELVKLYISICQCSTPQDQKHDNSDWIYESLEERFVAKYGEPTGESEYTNVLGEVTFPIYWDKDGSSNFLTLEKNEDSTINVIYETPHYYTYLEYKKALRTRDF